jgi:outer membrane protein OmpA-like peptidoglycan-associated protein
MRDRVVVVAGLLAAAGWGCPVHAQVSFDPRALQNLQSAPAPAPSAPPAAAPAPAPAKPESPPVAREQHPPPRAVQRRPEPVRPHPAPEPARPAVAHPPAPPPAAKQPIPPPPPPPPQAAAPPAPVIPAAPPPGVTLPPPTVVPARPPPPPAPVKVVAGAPGAVDAIDHGTRITFGANGTDLNPATDAAIRDIVHSDAAKDATFAVTAYAPGMPEDPSTARRLSLERALAVRSVLIAEGIPSVRIYVKALGSNGPGFADGPPDRVDVTIAPPLPTAQPTPAPAQDTAQPAPAGPATQAPPGLAKKP